MSNGILSENAIQVAESRYIRKDLGERSWEDCCKRVAKAVASIENGDKREFWQEQFFDMLFNLKALGGGRILRNAGTPSQKILNCHVLPLDDSILDIGEFIKKALVLNAEGGGVGCFPKLRPKGAIIKTKGGKSSGLLSFLQAISGVLDTVESGGNRRSGMLPIIDIEHPEVVDIINAKLKHDELNNFNISIGITNDFLDAVEQKKKWTLKFDGVEYEALWANDIFDLIVENNLKSGEPGLVNIHNMKITNTWYFSEIESLNLCSELKLSKNQSCCLGSIVLSNFLRGTQTDWKSLEETIVVLVRFLDNVLDINNYTFQDMKDASLSCRRLGIGIIGLGEFLLNKEIRYGSPEGIDKVVGIIRFLRDNVYKASIELAKERGAFPGFNKWAYLNSKFVKKLPARIRLDIKEFGIRNATTMAFAPGGSISLIADTTSGVEPLPMKAYIRKDKVGDRIYIHPKYAEILKENKKIPNWFVDSLDLSPEEHFETAVAIQSLNDGSISKTEILPVTTKHNQLRDWLLEYSRQLVGITTYVDGSRKDQILRKLSATEAKKYLDTASSSLSEEDVSCARGTCEI